MQYNQETEARQQLSAHLFGKALVVVELGRVLNNQVVHLAHDELQQWDGRRRAVRQRHVLKGVHQVCASVVG